MFFRTVRSCLAVGVLTLLPNLLNAEVSKGHRILIERGFQIQGLVQPDNYFHIDTYTNAGYTTVGFSFDSTGNLGPISTFTGEPPGLPWSRWAPDENNMPGQGSGQTGNHEPYSRTNEIPHLSQLVSMQLQDEWDYDDNPALLERLVTWFNAERTNWPNTILYHNNWGYQIANEAVYADFVNRAKPDMLSFDTYPWQSVYDTGQPNSTGPAIPGPGSIQMKWWYRDMRQVREYARGAGIPMAVWRQTWHGVQSWDAHVYRDPSPSELRLNTFSAIAFSAKFFSDFTYNPSSGSLFTKIFNGSGDLQTNANGLYAEMAEVNKQVRNWGNTLVRLTPIMTEGIPGNTTSILYIRGKDANGNLSPIPEGFVGDQDTGGGNATYTDWVYQRNDPHLRGWAVTNKAGIKNNGNPGDVLISWFKPLDESFDGPDYSNEIYMMVVNGLSDPTGTAADCLQEITLNFNSHIAALEVLNPQTGVVDLQQLPLTNGVRQLILNLKGGEAALFKFADGAPFVGAQKAPVNGPVITMQPLDRENLLGTDAKFVANATGVNLTYQWQFNGVDISGATTNTFTRFGVQAGDAGSYTLVVSNTLGTATSTPATLTVVSAQPFFYEPFDYSNVGAPVSSNTPANWAYGGTGTNDTLVRSGSLSYPGLLTSVGNSITNGGVGLGVRRLFGTNINSGTVFFSALFRMNDLGYGVWNGAAAQIGALTATDNTSFRLAVMIKSNSSNGYVIGVQKGGAGATATYSTTEFHAGETVYLVGRYEFGVSPNAVTLWINPDPATLAGSSVPATNYLYATSGTDGFTIDRFNFRQNTAASIPASVQWDEFRLGSTWRDATPIVLPPPPTTMTGITRLGDGQFQFSFTNGSPQSGSIYASTNLTNWVLIGTPNQVAPGAYQFIASSATNYPRRFYQLRWP